RGVRACRSARFALDAAGVSSWARPSQPRTVKKRLSTVLRNVPAAWKTAQSRPHDEPFSGPNATAIVQALWRTAALLKFRRRAHGKQTFPTEADFGGENRSPSALLHLIRLNSIAEIRSHNKNESRPMVELVMPNRRNRRMSNNASFLFVFALLGIACSAGDNTSGAGGSTRTTGSGGVGASGGASGSGVGGAGGSGVGGTGGSGVGGAGGSGVGGTGGTGVGGAGGSGVGGSGGSGVGGAGGS